MFSFLNTAILAAAAAALIPLIIHLFSRRKIKVVEFSSVRHLKLMQRRQVRRLKIRQLLLLILRTLVILAVVLAFARPTLKESSIGAKATVSAVVLLDNTASMNRYITDGNLFEKARTRAAEILQTLGPQDEAAILTSSYAPEGFQPSFTTPASAQERLSRIEPLDGAANLGSALEQAAALLGEAHNLNREIYIVTDRQRLSLPDSQVLAGDSLALFLADLPIEESDNTGIIGLDFSGQLLQVGHEFTMTATIKNYSGQRVSERLASLLIDGRRVAQSEFAIEAGSEVVVRFAHTVAGTGLHGGYVEISDDSYLADNRYYFSFKIPSRFNVLAIQGDESAEFINLALAPTDAGGEYWAIKKAQVSELPGVNFMEYDAIILAGVATLEESPTNRLHSYVERGGSLLYYIGAEARVAEFNPKFAQLTGVTLTESVPASFTRAGFYTIKSVDKQHPIFSVFEFPDGKIPQIKFFALPKMTIDSKASVLMHFSGDRPALVENSVGEGRVITFTGPLSPVYSEMFGHGFFVPFISRTVEYLAADLSEIDTRLRVGQVVTRPIAEQVSSVTITAPDSTTRTLETRNQLGLSVVQTLPAQAGLYQLSVGTRPVDLFAANTPPEEGDLAAADFEQFAQALGTENYHTIESNGAVAPIIAGFRIGRELWPFFLWVAVALLVAEMLLSRSAQKDELP